MEEQQDCLCGWYRPEYRNTTCAYRDFYKCTAYGIYRICPLRAELEKLEESLNKEQENG